MVVALVSDLLFSSKIRMEATAKNKPLRICRNNRDFVSALEDSTPDCIVIDLNSRTATGMGAVRMCKQKGLIDRVVAFCSHVDRELQHEAEAEGVRRVLARSQFVREIPRLMS